MAILENRTMRLRYMTLLAVTSRILGAVLRSILGVHKTLLAFSTHLSPPVEGTMPPTEQAISDPIHGRFPDRPGFPGIRLWCEHPLIAGGHIDAGIGIEVFRSEEVGLTAFRFPNRRVDIASDLAVDDLMRPALAYNIEVAMCLG